MKILHDVYEHDFGLLLPCKSGVAWEHQTAGVLCHHPVIEGIFLPLPKPYSYPKGVNSNDLLSQLTQANYKRSQPQQSGNQKNMAGNKPMPVLHLQTNTGTKKTARKSGGNSMDKNYENKESRLLEKIGKGSI